MQRICTDPAILTLHACFQHPSVATIFVGPRSVEEVNDALEAMKFRPSTELMEKVSGLMAPTFNTSWRSGLPENQPPLGMPADRNAGAGLANS
jgi:predicted aldo/keto reductase-like oxidoreductase